MECFSSAALLAWQANGVAAVIDGQFYLWIALAVGGVGLIAAFGFARFVLASDTGSAEMQKIKLVIGQIRFDSPSLPMGDRSVSSTEVAPTPLERCTLIRPSRAGLSSTPTRPPASDR